MGNYLPNTIASISVGASGSPDDGHFYWYYRFLDQKQRSGNALGALTLGPLGAEAPHVRGIFAKGSRRKSALLSAKTISNWNLCVLKAETLVLIRAGVRRVQFYEGGIAELFLAGWLSIQSPELKIIFNFHWADEWLVVLKTKRLRLVVAQFMKLFGGQIIFAAESSKLANRIETVLSFPVATYPIIAAFDPPSNPAWSERENDVLFLPQRADEVESCFRIAGALKKRGITSILGIKERVLDSAQHRIARIVAGDPSDKNGSPWDLAMLPLEDAEYKALISNSRIVVLPYSKKYFEWGSSGKFNESIALGSFPFVPDSTAILGQARAHNASHAYAIHNVPQTTSKIAHRLSVGFPEDSRAWFFDDLIAWSEKVFDSMTTPVGQGSRRKWCVLITLILETHRQHLANLAGSFFRPDWSSFIQRLLRRVGAINNRSPGPYSEKR